MTNDIFCVGLTRTELQTLGVLLPITFRIIPVSLEALDHAAVVRVIDQARCIILNPKRLSVDLLDDFLRGQDYQRWNNAPVPIILFSDTMTKEQRHFRFNFRKHRLKTGAVIGHAAHAIIHKKCRIREMVLPCIPQKHILLRRDL